MEFKEHNLLKDPYPDRCDLIVPALIHGINGSLYDLAGGMIPAHCIHCDLNFTGCFLFVGSTEQIIQPEKIGYDTYQSFFYRKK